MCDQIPTAHYINIYIIYTCIPYAATATALHIRIPYIIYIGIGCLLDIYRIEEMTYYAPHALLRNSFKYITH